MIHDFLKSQMRATSVIEKLKIFMAMILVGMILC